MASISDDKHSAIAKIVSKGLRGSGQKYDDAVRELIELCADEIAKGLTEGGGVLALTTAEHVAAITRSLAYVSAARVIATAKEKRPTNLPKYVRNCAAEVAKETRAEQEARVRRLKPQEILKMVLGLPRPAAASVLELLTFKQRNALVESIKAQMGGKRVGLGLGDKHEPEDPLLWAIWYVARLHALEPEAKRAFTKKGQPSQTCLLIDLSGELGPQPKNKHGEPINLAGPALVKVFEALTGLPTNQLPAEASSKSKLGLSFHVSRKVIARWRKHPEWKELQVETTPDGKGGLYWAVDRENQLRSARIATGETRGPKKSKDVSEDTS